MEVRPRIGILGERHLEFSTTGKSSTEIERPLVADGAVIVPRVVRRGKLAPNPFRPEWINL